MKGEQILTGCQVFCYPQPYCRRRKKMDISNRTSGNKKIIMMTTSALMTAIICILGPLSLPIGPVPVSLTNLAIYLTMYILDWKAGTIAYCLYMLIGLIGLPVFSGFAGGPGKLFGPTGGYIIGFLPMAIVIGLGLKGTLKLAKKSVILSVIASILLMEAATWIPYLLGTAWLAYSMKMTFIQALGAGVIPFIIEDLIKMVIVAIVGPTLRKTLAPYSGVQ